MSWNGVKKQTQRQDIIAWCDEMGKSFYCNDCKVKFTKEDVKKVCRVKGDIKV